MFKKNIIIPLVITFLLLFTESLSIGADFSVSDTTSFQAALTTAMSNGEDDVISVDSGTYYLSSTLTYILPAASSEGYSLTIEGAGSDNTILDGDNGVQILRIDTQEATDDSNAHFIIRHMTLQNGSNSEQAAGLSIWTNFADITLDGCVVKNNISTGTSYGDGGGARLRSQSAGEITVKNSEFNSNSAYYGGGLWAISYFGTSDKNIQFINNSFINNSARHSYGGLYVYEQKGTVKISGNLVTGNSANYSGGGVWAELYTSGSSPDTVLIMTNNIFSDNSVDVYNGGGAYAHGGYGNTYIFNNTFINNSATQEGGGLYINVAYSYSVDAFIYNNIFWNNSADVNGDDLYIEDKYDSIRQDGSHVDFYNNLYNELYIENGNFLSQGSNITGTNPDLDSDYHLLETSPCIEAGTDGVPDPPGLPSEDYDGESRIMDGDENGSAVVDIGADEWYVETDLCPNDPDKTEPGVCGCGVSDTDTDSDGIPDCNDECSNDPDKTDPGVCGCGTSDTDSDGDGTPDCNDECSNNPDKTAPGVCGCGTADTDTDDDGTPDCNDECLNDPDKIASGVCGCGTADTDTDGDGTPDCNDECLNDPDKIASGVCGCGNPDVDSEPDGMIDCWEVTYGLNTSLDDAEEDLDEDGFKNIDEYSRGTDPQDPESHPPRVMPWLPILLEE